MKRERPKKQNAITDAVIVEDEVAVVTEEIALVRAIGNVEGCSLSENIL